MTTREGIVRALQGTMDELLATNSYVLEGDLVSANIHLGQVKYRAEALEKLLATTIVAQESGTEVT